MKRDFIPQDELSKFDYLFEERARVFEKFTGKVKEIDEDGTALIWSVEVEGCLEDDPETWIIATPALWLRSAVKPNEGDYLSCAYVDQSGTYAEYYGSDIDHESEAIDGKDVLYSNVSSLVADRTSGETILTLGTATVKVSVLRASVKFGACELYVTAAGVFATNGAVTINLLTHIHQTGVGPSSPPQNGS